MRRLNAYLLLCLGVAVSGCASGRATPTSPEPPKARESTLGEVTADTSAAAATAGPDEPPLGDQAYEATTPARIFEPDEMEEEAPDQTQVEELQRRLAERDKELEATRSEVDALRQGATDKSGAAAGGQAALAATEETARQQALLRGHLGQERSRRREIEEELEDAQVELKRAIERLTVAEKGVPTVAAASAEAVQTQSIVEEHNRQLATLRARLAQEHWRRRDVEEELQKTSMELQKVAQSVEGSAVAPGAADVADAAENTEGLQQALEEANRQVTGLQSELEEERQTRVKAEEQLLSLRAEASTSPFETDRSVDQQQLVELQEALASERQQRKELANRYDALQQQVAAAASTAAPTGADESEELASLQLQQQRAMAVLQQELAETQQREGELRQTLAATTEGQSSELAEQLVDVQAQNSDLQTSLDEQRQRNEELSTKLEAATRVAELIFKMQNQQAQ